MLVHYIHVLLQFNEYVNSHNLCLTPNQRDYFFPEKELLCYRKKPVVLGINIETV